VDPFAAPPAAKPAAPPSAPPADPFGPSELGGPSGAVGNGLGLTPVGGLTADPFASVNSTAHANPSGGGGSKAQFNSLGAMSGLSRPNQSMDLFAAPAPAARDPFGAPQQQQPAAPDPFAVNSGGGGGGTGFNQFNSGSGGGAVGIMASFNQPPPTAAKPDPFADMGAGAPGGMVRQAPLGNPFSSPMRQPEGTQPMAQPQAPGNPFNSGGGGLGGSFGSPQPASGAGVGRPPAGAGRSPFDSPLGMGAFDRLEITPNKPPPSAQQTQANPKPTDPDPFAQFGF